MRCMRPIKAGQDANGNIIYNTKSNTPGLLPFEFECRKCLPCRLNLAREKAIRAVHEAKMHEGNIFLTLTYNDDNLVSDRLQYIDFQLFVKRLREKVTRGIQTKEVRDALYIPYMVTGEYGELTKRPHWHALLFNYFPSDYKYKYTTDLGHKVYESETLEKLWQKGNIEFGEVTMESAGYVARYAAKKLVHGNDQDHDYHPIHKVSSRRAIGRSWIESYWKHTFDNGFVVDPTGNKLKIPRYYVDWLKKNKEDEYIKYIFGVREDLMKKAEKKARKEEQDWLTDLYNRRHGSPYPQTRAKVKETVLKSKFKKLQENLKL